MRRFILAIAMLVAACDVETTADNAAINDLGNDTMMDANAVDMGADDNLMLGTNMAADMNALDMNAIADPEESVFCERFRVRMTRGECDRLNEQYDNLSTGVGTLAAENRMHVGRAYEARLAIGRSEDEVAVTDVATGGAADPANTQAVATADIRIGRYMRATLRGAQFEIEPQGEAERDLGSSFEETWIWRVTPRAEGSHVLTAQVEALASPSGSRLGPLITRQLPITVTVTEAEKAEREHAGRVKSMGRFEEFIRSATGIVLALAALIAAAGLVIWRVKSLGKRPEEPPGSGGGGPESPE